MGTRYTAFRDGVVAALATLPNDTVVVSHFVAINAAIGVAVGDDFRCATAFFIAD